MQYSKKGLLRTTVLAAALFGVYGVASADPLPELMVSGGSYYAVPNPDRPETAYSTIVVTDRSSLDASGLSITSTVSGTRGAVRALYGSTIRISDSTIQNDATSKHGFGLQAVSRAKSYNDAVTRIDGSNLKIITSGENGIGVQAFTEDDAGDRGDVHIELTGSTPDANTVTTSGENGWGVVARGTSKNGKGDAAGRATIITRGTIITTTGDYGFGAFADERGARIELNGGSITTGGTATGGNKYGSIGVLAKNGGSVSINGTSIKTTGNYADGLRAEVSSGADEANSITTRIDGTAAVETTGDHAHAAYAMGGVIELGGGSLLARGSYANGAYAVGEGSSIITRNVAIEAKGSADDSNSMAAAVRAANGAIIDVSDGSISATGGNFARGVLATDGATIKAQRVAISTTGQNSHAVHAWSKASETPTIRLIGGTVSTAGVESYGLSAQNGGFIFTEGTAITTAEQAGFGAFAYNGGNVLIHGGSITTNGKIFDHPLHGDVGAFGVLSKKGSAITLEAGTTVTTFGAKAEGLRAESEASAASSVTASDITVRTHGREAHGIGVYGSDLYGTDIASSINLSRSSINVTGADSSGVFLEGQSKVTLKGVTVESTGASINSIVGVGQSQTIDIVSDTANGTSYLQKNNGILLEVSEAPPLVGFTTMAAADGHVTLNLGAGTFATGNVKTYDPNVVTVNSAGAHWAGLKIDGDTEVDVEGTHDNVDHSTDVAGASNSTIVFNNNTFDQSVASGASSNVSFNGTTTVGGQVLGQSDSTMSFNGPSTTISGGVVGVGSAFSFTGGSTTINNGLAASGGSVVFNSTNTNITGNVELTGGALLKGGTADNPIKVIGGAAVNNGATLGGNVNFTGELTGQGGTLGPGNSIGVQTYGSLGKFTGDYVAEVNASGESDLIRITSGSADLRGINLIVSQENGNGGYKLDHDYTIVETGDAHGISSVEDNGFANKSLDSSFDGTLVQLNDPKFGANTVTISLSADDEAIDLARDGLSKNQNATLDGVLSVAGKNASADAALQSTDYKDALSQLSGELHASTQTALLNNSQLVTRTLSNRMRANLGAGLQAGAPTAQASGAVAGSMPTSNAYPLWAQVVGSWTELDDDGNAAKAKSDTAGLFIGADTQVGQGWRVGAALGFTDGDVKVNDRNSKSDVTSYTAALYGGNSWKTAKGQVNFLAGAAYTNNEVDSRRTVTVGGAQTLKADYDVNTTQLFTELGYAIPVGQASVVEPYLGLAWMSQKAKSFNESGGSAALHGDSQTDDVTTFTLGLRGATTITTGKSEARLMAGLGWRHASGDVDASRSMSFIEGAGQAFSIAGAPIAKNAAVVDLGAEMNVGKNTALGLSYAGQFGNGASDNAGSVYLRVRF